MNDTEVITDILNGNTERYREIVDEYQQLVADLTYKLCGNKFEIDEVVQQVFVELYVSLPHFQFKSKLSTFIYRITVNTVSKMLYKSSRIVRPTEDALEIVSSDRNVEQRAIHDEQIAELRAAIGKLKVEQRTALVLYTYEDFSYQEIADVMQISLSKVESLIFRAKKKLAEMLNR